MPALGWANFPAMKKLTIECPDDLHVKLQELVMHGWEDSAEEAVIEAIRRYVRAREPRILEKHLKQDIEWGLHGQR